MKHYYTLMCSLLATTLIGCGGGGSGDSGGGFDPRGAMITAEKTQVTVEVSFADLTSPPDEIIRFSVSDAPPEGYTVGLLQTENLSLFVDFVATGTLTAEMILRYPIPRGMTPGVYEDSIDVLVCLDDFCDQQIQGSPLTITSRFVVRDSTMDPRFSQTQIDTPARELVWNSDDLLMYATVPENDGSVSRAIAVIDPQVGEIVRTVPLQHEPDQLAISNDNEYLYVGYRDLNEVHRFTVPDLVQDLTISLGESNGGPFGDGPPYTAGDIAVHPQESRTVAVARQLIGIFPGERDLFVFDEAVARPLSDTEVEVTTSNPVLPSMIAWNDDGSKIYSKNFGSQAYAYDVSSEGLTLVAQTVRAFTKLRVLGKLIYDDGTLIDPNGDLVDADTGTHLGRYTFNDNHVESYQTSISLDGEMVFAVDDGQDSSLNLTMSSYFRDSLEPIQSIYVGNTSANPISSMIAWGANGVAFSMEGGPEDEGGIAILEGSFFTSTELMEPTSRSQVHWGPGLQVD